MYGTENCCIFLVKIVDLHYTFSQINPGLCVYSAACLPRVTHRAKHRELSSLCHFYITVLVRNVDPPIKSFNYLLCKIVYNFWWIHMCHIENLKVCYESNPIFPMYLSYIKCCVEWLLMILLDRKQIFIFTFFFIPNPVLYTFHLWLCTMYYTQLLYTIIFIQFRSALSNFQSIQLESNPVQFQLHSVYISFIINNPPSVLFRYILNNN